MRHREFTLLATACAPDVVLLDDRARRGTRLARRRVQKAFLSMCLGSAISLTVMVVAASII